MKRALLVGIRTVPNIPEAFGRPLRGCHNDVERMSGVLSAKYAFEDLRVLIDRFEPSSSSAEADSICSCTFCSSPESTRFGNRRVLDSLPTRDAIRRAVLELTEDAGEKDIVVIFYSGHGSEFVGSGPLVGHRFQTIVPHDSGRGGDAQNRDIFDTEVDLWTKRLNEKTPYVTLIFDSCHSGGVADASRSGISLASRRVRADRRPVEAAFEGGAMIDELRRSLDERPPRPNRSRGTSAAPERGPSGWIRSARSVIVLAACRAHQESLETESSGKPYGRFTHELARALETTAERRWSRVFPSVLEAFRNEVQQPQREADGPVFAEGEVDPDDIYPPQIIELKKFAVVVGIDYGREDDEGGFAPLKTPVADAEKVAQVLRDEQQYEIVGLAGPKPLVNEQATRKNIHRLLDKLARKVGSYRDAAVVIYFAGHGEVDPDDRGGFHGYVIPWDAKRHDRSTWLPMRDLRDHLKEGISDRERLTVLGIAGKDELRALDANHLLLVLDCCFAGAMSLDWFLRGRIPERPIYYSEYKRFVEGSAWQLLTSATMSQRAHDVDPRAGAGAHSPFASAFIEGLKTESADGFRTGSRSDRIITATELHQFIDGQLRALDRPEVAVQTPSLMDLKPKDGEFIFTVPGWTPKPALDPQMEPGAGPWWGSRPYETIRTGKSDPFVSGHENEGEDPLFFGQQRATLQLAQRIVTRSSPVLAIIGPSGSGKSSVVRAGLLPLLQDPVKGRQRVRTWVNNLGWERFLTAPEEIEPLRAWARSTGLHQFLGRPQELADRIRELLQRARNDGLFDAAVDESSEERLARAQARRLGVDVLLERTERENRLRLARRLQFLDLLDSPTELAYEVELWMTGVPQILNAPAEELIGIVGDWNVISARVEAGASPVPMLEQAAAAIVKEDPQKRNLLFVDQFDDFLSPYIADAGALVRAFRSCREALTRVGGQLLITLRSDALVRDDRRARLVDLLEEWEEFELPAPRHDALREVIEGPAGAAALTFEPRQLVEEMIETVRDRPAPLALLSGALAKMYDVAAERRSVHGSLLDRHLSREDWRTAGGAEGHILDAIDRLQAGYASRLEHRKVLEALWLRFAQEHDGQMRQWRGRRVDWRQLVFAKAADQQYVDEVFEDLIRIRAVVADRNGLHLASPNLVGWKPLESSLEGYLSAELMRDLWHAAVEWDEARRDERMVWIDDSRLAPLVKADTDPDILNRLEREFLEASVHARKEIVARRLAREATRIAGLDWSRGALLAVEAATLSESAAVMQALHDVLARTPLSTPFQLPGGVFGMEFTDGARTLRVATKKPGTPDSSQSVAWVLDVESLDWALEDGDVPSGEGRVRDGPEPAKRTTRRAPELDVPESSLGPLPLPGHDEAPQFYAFSRGGDWLASGLVPSHSDDGEIRLWRMRPPGDAMLAEDTDPAEVFPGEPKVLRGEERPGETLEQVTFTSDGSLVATRRNLPPLIWDLTSTWPASNLLDAGEGQWSSAESPSRLWTGQATGRSITIRERSGAVREVTKLETPLEELELLAVSANAEVVVASDGDGSRDTRVFLWDRRKPEAACTDLERPFRTMTLSADGSMFALESEGSWIELWETRSLAKPGTALALPSDYQSTGVFDLQFDPRGRWLLTLGNGRAAVWSVPGGAWVEPRWPDGIRWERDAVTAAAFSSDGGWLCLGTLDGDVVLVDLKTDALDSTLIAPGVKGSVESIAFDADSTRLAVGARGMVHIWQPLDCGGHREEPLILRSERRHGFRVQCVRFNTNATQLATLLRAERAAYSDRVVVFRLDRSELMQLAWANAGRELTEYERTRFVRDEITRGRGAKLSALFREEARALHRSIILGK
jgi:WD40 repeat protein